MASIRFLSISPMDIYIYYLVLWNCLDFLLWALLN
ncbi:hypothetical protein SAMN05216300_12737, partial [Nitrosomonas oligotropha]